MFFDHLCYPDGLWSNLYAIRLAANRLPTGTSESARNRDGQPGVDISTPPPDSSQSRDFYRRLPLALVVLDVMLPGGSGLDLLKTVRASSKVPVVLLSAMGEAADRIVGLQIGADDYLAKPFEPRELVARIHAILRRTRNIRTDGNEIKVGDVALSAVGDHGMMVISGTNEAGN